MSSRGWDMANQMPAGQEFEAYHQIDTTVQPLVAHSHRFYEFYFFQRGCTRITMGEMELYPKRGDVLIFPPDRMHGSIHLDSSTPYERFYVYASRAFLSDAGGRDCDLPAAFDRLVQEKGCCFHLRDAALDELMRLTDDAILASGSGDPVERMLNRHRMSLLLLRTLMLLRQSDEAAGNVPGRMNDVLSYLNAHAAQELTLDHLEEVFFVSKYALSREFKEYTGMSIHQYILAKRVLMAKELLRQGLRPGEACLRCGFSDYAGFYRVFRMRTGMSPAAYVQSVLEEAETGQKNTEA